MNFFKINGCALVSMHFEYYIVASLSWSIHYILKALSRGNLYLSKVKSGKSHNNGHKNS